MKSNATVKWKGVDLYCEYDFERPEHQTHDYPGSGWCIDINAITVNGGDVFALVIDDLDNIEELIIEQLENE